MEKILSGHNIKTRMYSISDQGDIINNDTGRKLKTCRSKPGYPTVGLQLNDNSRKNFLVHRLVAEHFVENPNPKKFNVVHHKNFVKDDFRSENLEWTDRDTNNKIGSGDGTTKTAPYYIKGDGWGTTLTNGEKNGMHRISESQARTICEGLEQGYRYKDVAISAGLEGNRNDRYLVGMIARHKRWKHISKDYNI